jgi:hypothetical protein
MKRKGILAGRTPVDDASTPLDSTPRKSGMVRLVELFYDITFTSPIAIRCLNISALGFLGSLGFLGFVPLPGWHFWFGFQGLYGFFGLIGVAFMFEFAQRRRSRRRTTGTSQ